MNIAARNRTRIFVALAVLALSGLACSLTAGEQPPTPPAPTVVIESSTRMPLPEPTATQSPTPSPTVDITAVVAQQTADALHYMEGQVQDEMTELGLPADTGHLAWFSTSNILLTTVDYQGLEFRAIPDLTASNFILKVDIIWDTTSGLAGCALPFRADGDFKTGATYMLMLMRLSGAPAWDIEYWQDGVFERAVRAAELSDSIDDRAGRKNSIILIAQDNEFSVYINGDKMSTARDSKLPDGKLGFSAWQESGETTCRFENAWLWILD